MTFGWLVFSDLPTLSILLGALLIIGAGVLSIRTVLPTGTN